MIPTPYYDIDGITIYHGDCRDILPYLPKVDLVLTDPPYGIEMDKGFTGFGGFGEPIARKRYENDKWDSKRPDQDTFNLLLDKTRLAFIFGGNFFADMLPQGRHWIVWDKLNTMPSFGDCELVWTNVDRKSVKKITREYNGLLGKEEARQHPTQKPMSIMGRILETYSLITDTILDPFMGSGTTLVAAKQLGRKAIGIEIEEKYCEIAVKRLGQGVLAL
jgi:DNA modification methylase